jgi:flagellar hook-basal body complex protein FliE
MSQMDIDQVLAQIRTLRAQAGGLTEPAAAAGPASGAGSFANVLRAGLDQVNAAQGRARELATAFEHGKPGVELPQVMLEMQKASVSFRAAVEVRNKLLSAYQDVMNMPV